MKKIFVRKKTDHFYFDPYTPLVAQGGVSFPHVFFISEPAQNGPWKSGWWIKMQYYYIGYETRGGVDVKPPTRISKKRVFGGFVLKTLKNAIFENANFVFFGKPRLRTCVIFYFFFSCLCSLKMREQISISPRVSKMPKNVVFRPFFREISGNFGFFGDFQHKTRDFFPGFWCKIYSKNSENR